MSLTVGLRECGYSLIMGELSESTFGFLYVSVAIVLLREALATVVAPVGLQVQMVPNVVVHVRQARRLELIAQQANKHLLHAPRLGTPAVHLAVVFADLCVGVVLVRGPLAHFVES